MIEKKHAPFMIVLLIFWLLTACGPVELATPTNKAAYSDLINHPDCSSPCWAGIQVETTGFSTAKEILIQRYGSASIQVVDNKYLSWQANQIDGLKQGNLYFSNEIVTEILLVFDSGSNFSVTNLFDRLGEPAWVQVTSDPNNSCLGLGLLYPSFGIYVGLDMNANAKGVQPSQHISILRFLQTELTEHWNINDGYMVKWGGYKEYCGG